MGRITIERAGLEYDIIQSNSGVRLEHGGAEIFRHFPGDIVPPTGTIVTDPATFATTVALSPEGSNFVLGPGLYQIDEQLMAGRSIEAETGRQIKRVERS